MNTLEFNKGVATLDIPTLRRTTRYEMANGRLPKNRPVEHFELLDRITDTAAAHRIEPEPGPVYASERQALRLNWKGNREECPVENFLIQRCVGMVHLDRQNEQGQNMGIAFSYNERGLTLAFGVNIWLCSNMQIFGEHKMSTFGNGKVGFEDMMNALEIWMQQFGERRELQMQTIQELSRFEIGESDMNEVIGDLFTLAVKENNGLGSGFAPLNQAQVADLVKASQDELYRTDRPLSAYDLVQWGTHSLKPDRSDLVTVIDHSHDFCQYVADRFTTVHR